MTRPPLRPAAFAIPGDIDQKTGGYIYERRLLLGLREEGRAVAHIPLPGSFPDPSAAEMASSIAAMAAVPADTPLIIDGLVYGSVETAGLDAVRAPIVAMIHHPLGLETGLSPDRARHLCRLEAENLKRADHVVVPSPHTAAILSADFGVAPERMTIAPPGLDKPVPGRTEQTPPLILSIGLLAARKGHDVLLDALGAIRDLDWTAQIVGATHDDAVAEALHLQRSRLGLEPRVRFAGLIEDAAIETLYRSASIFALATRYEGYGMVFGEAMAYGLPIVTCRAGAVPDTVPAEAGLLVPVDDPAAFAAALRRLLGAPDLRRRMARASARAGAALPGWADTAAAMSRVLDRLAP